MSLCHLHTFLANGHFAYIIQNMILLHGNKMCNQVISVKAYFHHCWLIITSTDFGSVRSTLQQFKVNWRPLILKVRALQYKGLTASILGSKIMFWLFRNISLRLAVLHKMDNLMPWIYQHWMWKLSESLPLLICLFPLDLVTIAGSVEMSQCLKMSCVVEFVAAVVEYKLVLLAWLPYSV